MIFTINHVVVTTIITLIIYNPEKTLQLSHSVSPLINVQILQINIDILTVGVPDSHISIILMFIIENKEKGKQLRINIET